MFSLSDFDFELPEELIALEPLAQRDRSRLLHVSASGDLFDRHFQDLAEFFQAGDVLILNDSRVLPAALTGFRRREGTEARVHVNLHKKCSEHEWFAFAKPLKRLRVGDQLVFKGAGPDVFALEGALGSQKPLGAVVAEITGGGEILLAFDQSGKVLDKQLHLVGDMPLPPYIAGRRRPTAKDRETYQTVYATAEGSVAAPTAGLHFTDALLDQLRNLGVDVQFVTLHVGAGTFLPVKTDDINAHKMHAEWGVVDQECVDAIQRAREKGGRVTAVGTTSLRLLESAALGGEGLAAWRGDTDIFIRPGFDFKVVDRLLTNFHLPKSTLFMLVSAFAGFESMKQAYTHAIAKQYRFYSYGDVCFLEKSSL